MGAWRPWLRNWRRRPDDEWGLPASPGPAGPVGPGGSYRPRRSRTGLHLGPLSRLALLVLLALLLSSYALYRLDRRFRPALAAIGEMKAKAIASQAVNEALTRDVFNDVRYDQLMDVKMDPEGKRVLLMQANTPELARIAGRAQRQVWERLQQLNGQPMRIPIAQVMGWTLFGNWGPGIPVTFHPVGAAITDIRQLFQSGGINQTQHIVYAHTEVTIRVLVPLVSHDVVVTTNTFITAAVLNGEVPTFYLNGVSPAQSMPAQAVPPLLAPGTSLLPGTVQPEQTPALP